MRPRKRTAKIEAYLNGIARAKAAIPNYQQMQEETGLSLTYLRAVISAKVREFSNKCVESKSA